MTPTVSLLNGFQGLNYGNTSGSVPPDTIAASSPTSVVETVNTSIAIYGNNSNPSPTTILSPTSLNTFFAPAGSINTLSDASVAYNTLTGQFFVGAINLTTNIFGSVTADSYVYAVSKTSSPTTANTTDWNFYSVNLTSLDPAGSGKYWGDYPRLGWNANAYVVSFNMFTTSGQTYNHPLVLNINSAAPATTTLVDVPGGVTNSTVVPAVMYGSTAADPMYLVEETLNAQGSPTGNAISVGTETNLFTTPTFTFQSVALPAAAAYTAPPSATQQGSANQIQTNDSRILNAQWSNNELVASQTVGVSTDTQAHARWYQFDTTNFSSTGTTLVQNGTIGVGSGSNSYFPSVALAPNGTIGMTYMESSPTEYMSVYVTGRLASDPTGQMEAPVLAQAGQAVYKGFDTPPYRAGDYSGITPDPNSNGTFWSANEYATSNTTQAANWGTAVAHFQVSNPAAPPTISSASANPNPVTGTSTVLSATASDPNAGGTISSYTWSVLPGFPGGVTFDSNNGTSAGSKVTATFTQAGSYTFQVKVTDSLGASSTATVAVTVNQTQTSVTVSPSSATVGDGTTQQFTATTLDQFGKAMASQPTFAWSLVSPAAGSINSATGLYAAPSSGTGSDTVQATANGQTGTATAKYGHAPALSPPSASPNPVTGKTTVLSASASDPNPNGTLSYSWSVSSGPAGVTFSPGASGTTTINTAASATNGESSSNSVTANFTQAGNYTFQVTVTDSLGLSSTATVAVTVNQAQTSVTVSPATASVSDGTTQQFTATAKDQFGAALASQPTFTWSASAGSFSTTTPGLYTAPSSGSGQATVTATAGGQAGTATVNYSPASQVIEGFETTSPSTYLSTNYSIAGGTSYNASVDTAAAHNGTYGLDQSGGSQWIYSNSTNTTVQFGEGQTASVWVQFNKTADGRAYFGFGATSAGALSAVLAPNTGQFLIQNNSGWGYTNIGTASGPSGGYLANHWYLIQVAWGTSGTITANLYDSNGTTLLDTVSASTPAGATTSGGGIAFRNSGKHSKYWDTVTVTNGANPAIATSPTTGASNGQGASPGAAASPAAYAGGALAAAGPAGPGTGLLGQASPNPASLPAAVSQGQTGPAAAGPSANAVHNDSQPSSGLAPSQGQRSGPSASTAAATGQQGLASDWADKTD